ncbi:enoyl-CoA hydratase-related protein [Actinoplanes sp. NPDC051475]|uniref:enoyl-CoA hydratase-related protein n=1 Tax=Actinoplanes sp. NPDC051475 TaxID=3157225 RepID=UPI00344D2D0D
MSVLSVDTSRAAVARVALRSADARNRLDDDTVAALLGALDDAESSPGAGVFVITAEGGTFCSGMPFADVEEADWPSRTAGLHRLFHRLRTSPLVTVAVVDGAALGGGVGLAAACDHVIAGTRARFRMTEVLLGLVPALILPFVAHRVGASRAVSLALTATEVDGERAATLGLADTCALNPERELRRILSRLHASDGDAVRALKRYARALLGDPASDYPLAHEVLSTRLEDPRLRRRLAGLAALAGSEGPA